MGLDMYLVVKVYVGANHEHNKITGQVNIFKDGKLLDIPFKKIEYIELDGIYWRKANHIHEWFVKNIQDGEDDCKVYPVAKSDLEELSKLCRKASEIIEEKELNKILPTISGFFFGSTEYDEEYREVTKWTADEIDKLLEEFPDEEFEYYSSW